MHAIEGNVTIISLPFKFKSFGWPSPRTRSWHKIDASWNEIAFWKSFFSRNNSAISFNVFATVSFASPVLDTFSY